MKRVWISSCTAVSTSESSALVAGLSVFGGQKLMYPTSGRSGRLYQLASSRPQVTAWAPVVGPQDCEDRADTNTIKSASWTPWPPGITRQLRPSHTLQARPTLLPAGAQHIRANRHCASGGGGPSPMCYVLCACRRSWKLGSFSGAGLEC